MHCSQNFLRMIKSRKVRWAGHVVCIEERFLVGKLKWTIPLRRPRRGRGDNIKRVIPEMGCGSMDWIDLPQDRDRWRAILKAVMNFHVP